MIQNGSFDPEPPLYLPVIDVSSELQMLTCQGFVSQTFFMFTDVNVLQSSEPWAISHRIYAHLFEKCIAMNNRNSIMHTSYKFNPVTIFNRSNLTEMIFHQLF